MAQAEFDSIGPMSLSAHRGGWATQLRDGAVADYNSFNQRMAASRQSYVGRRRFKQLFWETHKWPKALSRS